MAKIAVIVVNWNAKDDLCACLNSLFASPAPRCDFAVWVVDNASSDGSADMTMNEFPLAHLVRNAENLGFSKANNQAIALASDYDYVFLLNSDATVQTPAALDKLVEFGDEHPDAAVVGAKVWNLDGSIQFSCRHFPDMWAGLVRNTFVARFFPRNRFAERYLMTNVDHAKERIVDWVSGCAMMIRCDFIKKHGALDETFYMYCEDVDICKRAWDAGWSVWYCPDAQVTHKIGASSDKNAEKMIWAFHNSWITYYNKHNVKAPIWSRAAVQFGLWLRAAVRIAHRRQALRK